MLEVTWGSVIALAATTGLFTALVNQLLGGLFESRRQQAAQRHQRQMQTEERNHQRQMRAEQAHTEAREEYLGRAIDALHWLRHEWGHKHGLDVDWVPDFEPTPSLDSVTDVILALQEVGRGHPTREVREIAGSIHQEVSGHYGSIEIVGGDDDGPHYSTGTTPSDNQFRRWADSGEALIEAIHEPPR